MIHYGLEKRKMKSKKLPLSAIIVSCDEADLLNECLSSISFCDEVILVDLNSRDRTAEIGKAMADRVISHKRVPIVEQIYPEISTKNDWILLLDPDEVITSKLQQKIIRLFNTDLKNIGVIQLPWQFFFFNQKLQGTVWGGKKLKQSIFHRQRVLLYKHVHRAIVLKPPFESTSLLWESDCYVHHKWATNLSSFFEKHQRYLKYEGKAKFENGERYKPSTHFMNTLKSFKESFFQLKGYKDGFTGLVLSVFWMWYTYRSYLSLKQYEKKNS